MGAKPQDAMVDVFSRTGQGNRGLKKIDPGGRGYESVSALDIPSALVEPCFGDNPAEAVLGHQLKSDYAEGFGGGLCEAASFVGTRCLRRACSRVQAGLVGRL